MDSCRQTFGSNKYDLNSLSEFTLYGMDIEFQYAFTPCGVLKTNECFGRTFQNAMSCTYESLFNRWYTLSFLDAKSPYPPYTNASFWENPDGPGTGVLMITSNGDPCYGLTRFMRVKFICDKTAEGVSNITASQVDVCVFGLELRAKQACPLE